MAEAETAQHTAAAAPRGRETLSGVPDGLVPLVLAQLAAEATATAKGGAPALLHVARDDRRLEAVAEGLAFFAPKVRVIQLPAWDTVPYDRIGPNSDIVSRRIAALARLAATSRKDPTLVLTTVYAILQRLPPREFIRRSIKTPVGKTTDSTTSPIAPRSSRSNETTGGFGLMRSSLPCPRLSTRRPTEAVPLGKGRRLSPDLTFARFMERIGTFRSVP